MELDNLIKSKIKASRIYGVNKQSTIKEILSIPNDINLKKLDKHIDSFYDYFYIKKRSKDEIKGKEKELKYLNTNKEPYRRLSSIPVDEDKINYRRIVSIKEQWLKNSHKKLSKILMNIVLTEKEIGVKRKSIIPYLHSTVKQRSYHTNALVHIGDKYVFAMDIKDFYPSITKYKLYKFFVNDFNLSSDSAMIYSILSTCKSDDGSYKLGQGLSQSSILAYLVNYRLFNYLFEISRENEIDMSIYVDDVVFSSKKIIPQSFIDRLFGIIKGNEMSIKKEKIHNYKNKSVKKITGIYIHGNRTRVSNSKHHEFVIQYKYLNSNINNIKDINHYFDIYNLYLKFYGNYQHIKMVEGRVNDIFENFINKYDNYFPKGINKNNKGEKYTYNNIKRDEDKAKFSSCYKRLKIDFS